MFDDIQILFIVDVRVQQITNHGNHPTFVRALPLSSWTTEPHLLDLVSPDFLKSFSVIVLLINSSLIPIPLILLVQLLYYNMVKHIIVIIVVSEYCFINSHSLSTKSHNFLVYFTILWPKSINQLHFNDLISNNNVWVNVVVYSLPVHCDIIFGRCSRQKNSTRFISTKHWREWENAQKG